MVGTLEMIGEPIMGKGHNIQGKRDPAGNYHGGGSGDTPRRLEANQVSEATTLGTRNTGRRTPTQSRGQITNETDNAEAVRGLRKEPSGRLNQPRRQKQSVKIITVNHEREGTGTHRPETFLDGLYNSPIPISNPDCPGILTAGLAQKYLFVILEHSCFGNTTRGNWQG